MYKTAGKLAHLGKPVDLAGPVPVPKKRKKKEPEFRVTRRMWKKSNIPCPYCHVVILRTQMISHVKTLHPEVGKLLYRDDSA
jgi:hypothetical protein